MQLQTIFVLEFILSGESRATGGPVRRGWWQQAAIHLRWAGCFACSSERRVQESGGRGLHPIGFVLVLTSQAPVMDQRVVFMLAGDTAWRCHQVLGCCC